MLVTDRRCLGTIGGGQLEFRVVELARAMLSSVEKRGVRATHSFTLGPEMQQCCGGVVDVTIEALGTEPQPWIHAVAGQRARGPCVMVSTMPGPGSQFVRRICISAHDSQGSLGDAALDASAAAAAHRMLNLQSKNGIGTPDSVRIAEASPGTPPLLFEVINSVDFHLMLFGAGHVGKALVEVLSGLPCRITWVDSRADEFPANIPATVTTLLTDRPAEEVANAGQDCFFLVMTHSHPTDFQICKAVLAGEFSYLGLIGSQSKRNRFAKNLAREGIPEQKVRRLVCPIGIDTVRSKHPTAIAIAVAAQLLQVDEQRKRNGSAPIHVSERVPSEA